jgi:hypothetical protein
MAVSVSSADVVRLMAEPSANLCCELATKIAADLSGPALTPAEVKLAQGIVRILARDVEQGVRASLSRGPAPLTPPATGRCAQAGRGRRICRPANAGRFSGFD